jgi:hypothetical protein
VVQDLFLPAVRLSRRAVVRQALPKRRFRKDRAPHAVRAPDWAPMDVLLLLILAVILHG